MTNTVLLNEQIKKSGFRKDYIAKTLGISVSCLSHKIAGRREFKASEIKTLCALLDIKSAAIKEAIFFGS